MKVRFYEISLREMYSYNIIMFLLHSKSGPTLADEHVYTKQFLYLHQLYYH